jgi:hypothetical protein
VIHMILKEKWSGVIIHRSLVSLWCFDTNIDREEARSTRCLGVLGASSIKSLYES